MFRDAIRRCFRARDEFPKLPKVSAEKLDDGSYDIQVAIRCLIFQDKETNLWVARGLDLDFVASAKTRRDAMKVFQESLVATIEAHLDEFGSISALVKPAPEYVWKDLYATLLSQEPIQAEPVCREIQDGLRARARGALSFFAPPDSQVAHAH